MCCNECPFNPATGCAVERCKRPVCAAADQGCGTGFCARNLGNRCHLDYYVISHLYQQDKLAESLVLYSLKSALIGRDRALLLSLFHAASEKLRTRLWRWLEIYEPRSLWLLNPVFSAVGLAPLDSFIGVGSQREKYLNAIVANPYSGGLYHRAFNN